MMLHTISKCKLFLLLSRLQAMPRRHTIDAHTATGGAKND